MKCFVWPDLDRKMDEMFRGEKFVEILDVGGTRATYDFLKKRFPEANVTVINIDRSELRGLPDGVGILMNAEEMKFPDSRFDFVFCREVIEHIYRTDRLVSEVRRVLKSGGKVMVSTPNLNAWHIRIMIFLGYAPTSYNCVPGRIYGVPKFFKTQVGNDHVRVFPYRALRQVFGSCGFALEGMKGVAMYSKDSWMKNARKFICMLLPGKWKEGLLVKARCVK